MAAGLVIALASAGGLAGCDSTQQKNARAKLQATRELASRKAQHVTRRDPRVRVVRVALVRGRKSTALVVNLRSHATRPLTDVPITVGVRGRNGRRELLNGGRNFGWFETHVPAIPTRGTATWVFTTRHPVKPGGRLFARVGVPASPTISHASALPRIEAATSRGGQTRNAVRVSVQNQSDVPQYGLQIYAVVRNGSRFVAAGRAAIAHLGTSERTTARIRLTGTAHGRTVSVQAIPTIFE